jgi:hypothetical protein
MELPWNAEDVQALRVLDMQFARRIAPGTSDETRVVVLHKIRVECTALEPQYRLESIEWLRANGCIRMYGQPLPPPGVLPL